MAILGADENWPLAIYAGMSRRDGHQKASAERTVTSTIAGYLIRKSPAEYAPLLASLRASHIRRGRAVESWRETTSEDGLTLSVTVVYARQGPATDVSTETYTFPALGVLALEGKR